MSSVPKKEEKDAGKAAEQPVWEWENDGHWVPYADDVQGELETAYASKDKADVTIGGKYLVSVSALYQLNVQTMFQRQVRRRVGPADDDEDGGGSRGSRGVGRGGFRGGHRGGLARGGKHATPAPKPARKSGGGEAEAEEEEEDGYDSEEDLEEDEEEEDDGSGGGKRPPATAQGKMRALGFEQIAYLSPEVRALLGLSDADLDEDADDAHAHGHAQGDAGHKHKDAGKAAAQAKEKGAGGEKEKEKEKGKGGKRRSRSRSPVATASASATATAATGAGAGAGAAAGDKAGVSAPAASSSAAPSAVPSAAPAAASAAASSSPSPSAASASEEKKQQQQQQPAGAGAGAGAGGGFDEATLGRLAFSALAFAAVPTNAEQLAKFPVPDSKAAADALASVKEVASMYDRTGSVPVSTYILSTLQNGLPLFQAKPELNKQLIFAMQYVMHRIVAEQDPKTRRETVLALARAYESCQTIQFQTVISLFARLSNVEVTFEKQLLRMCAGYKSVVLDQVLFLLNPDANRVPDDFPHGQPPHIRSAYAVALWDEARVATEQLEGGRLDPNKTRMSAKDKQTVVALFKKLFSPYQFVADVLTEINSATTSKDATVIDRQKFYEFVMKVDSDTSASASASAAAPAPASTAGSSSSSSSSASSSASSSSSAPFAFDKFCIFFDEELFKRDPSEYPGGAQQPESDRGVVPYLSRTAARDVLRLCKFIEPAQEQEQLQAQAQGLTKEQAQAHAAGSKAAQKTKAGH